MARSRDEPVRLTRIYTRGGDAGETSLGDGSRVSKLDARIEAFGAVGTPREVAAQLRKRFEGAATRLSFYAPYPSPPELWVEVLDAMGRA